MVGGWRVHPGGGQGRHAGCGGKETGTRTQRLVGVGFDSFCSVHKGHNINRVNIHIALPTCTAFVLYVSQCSQTSPKTTVGPIIIPFNR